MVRGSRSICRTQAPSSLLHTVSSSLGYINFKETRRQFTVKSEIGSGSRGMNHAPYVLDELPNSGEARCISYFYQVLTGLARNKQYSDSVVMYRRFRDGIVPDFSTLTILMNCCCSLGFIGYGFGILAMTFKRGYLPNAVNYSLLIHGLCRSGKLERAKCLFDRMKREGVIPKVVTFSVLIRGLCQSGELEEAKAMYVEMKKNGIIPNVVTYSSLIHGLYQGGESEHAKRIFSDMKNSGVFLDLGDQASIIGGVIDYINELHQVLKSLEAKKRRKLYTNEVGQSPRINAASPRLFAPHRHSNLSPLSPRTPQSASPHKPLIRQPLVQPPSITLPTSNSNSSCSSVADMIMLMNSYNNTCNNVIANELVASSKSSAAYVSAAQILTLFSKLPGQTVKIVSAIEDLSLQIHQVSINTVKDTILNAFTFKIGIACQHSAEELAQHIQQTFC